MAQPVEQAEAQDVERVQQPESARSRLEEAERAGLRFAIMLRVGVMTAALIWYATVAIGTDFDRNSGGLASLIALFLSGLAHYAMIGTRFDRWWIKYVVVVVDVGFISAAYWLIPVSGASDIPQHMTQRIWGVQLLIPVVALAGLSLSWQFVIWAGMVVASGWLVTHFYLTSLIANPLGWGDLQGQVTVQDYQRVFMSVDFIGTGSRVVETGLILVVAAILAATVFRARQVLMAQLRAEREEARERQQRIFASDALARFVPATVARGMLEGRAEPPVQERDTAVLMLDIAGFSSFAAQHQPRQVIDSLDEYLSAASEIVSDSGGVTISFTGDGLLAAFNNPVEVEDPVRSALAAAVSILEKLSGSRFTCRIGLAYGPVVAGRIGSSSRQAFTVYGEAVNIAARLQDHGKVVDATLLVDRHFEAVEGRTWRALGDVDLKGIGVPVTAFCR